uniref:Uncharacterized protein n=1 Tax=Arundo donax TaxID=35708 RepID=A0A0A8YG75_ARUDO
MACLEQTFNKMVQTRSNTYWLMGKISKTLTGYAMLLFKEAY